VDPAGEGPLTKFYAEFTDEPTDFAIVVREKKGMAMRDLLGSDVNRLTALFGQICERHRRHRDYTRHELHHVLREVISSLPVYRTYVRAKVGQVSEDDSRTITEAVESAKKTRLDLDKDLFDFFRDILLLRVRGELETELVMRFQQLTGPVMAKGVEDTAFYCFNRLVALNEVGGDPGRFGFSPDDFHKACAETQAEWPRSMLASSTHDTKRSEDVRARLHLLSEIPDRWREAVQRWTMLNKRYRRDGLPDRNAEYLLYQTLVGAWPIATERMIAYMEKASREAKVHTSWTQPNPDYDGALQQFIEGILDDREFKADLETFVKPLIEPGRVNSLAQTLIKLTAPGVPDFYQGTELWDLSLVDPDNRRPVDYALRRRLLSELDGMTAEEIWSRIDEGLPKLWIIRQTLKLRRSRKLLEPESSYRPLVARGEKSAHVVAYTRGERIATVLPRLVIKLGAKWGDTTLELPEGRWRNAFTNETLNGGEIALAKLLKRFPVGLLCQERIS
jgi:(1->4)-alpha-D-glucan 1-alpha-D-glucosylmutase